MGPQARSVIPLLLECARSEDREVRSSALRVLFFINPDILPVGPLIKALEDKDANAADKSICSSAVE